MRIAATRTAADAGTSPRTLAAIACARSAVEAARRGHVLV